MDLVGINSFFHDSSVALFREGELLGALEEERWFRDEKHSSRFPARSLRWILEAFDARPQHLAFGLSARAALQRGGVNRTARRHFRAIRRALREGQREARQVLRAAGAWEPPQLHEVVHHDAHAASAFFLSPCEEAAVLTWDGSGEWTTTTIGAGRGNRIRRLRTLGLPDSLGGVYGALTEHLGFRRNSGEYKVMGLAPFGDPARYRGLLAEVLPLAGDLFRVAPWAFELSPFRLRPSQALLARLGPPREPEGEVQERHRDLAAALQERTEEVGLHLARSALRLAGSRNLVLAGGVAMNCVLNGRLARELDLDRLYVQPASSDAGISLGAAAWVWHQVLGRERSFVLERADWGPSYGDHELEELLRAGRLRWRKPARLTDEVAELLATGKVVGWFQGRAELGPRALGQRSLLADPSQVEMRERLNARVKHREAFRPFAPVTTAAAAGERFGPGADAFMTRTVEVLPAWRERLGAVTHVDGSARLQVAPAGSLLHDLLIAFAARRGLPVLLNTSFNVRGEPMVLTPRDALRCFFTTGIDHLALGSYIVDK